jgi:hypothetical protein
LIDDATRDVLQGCVRRESRSLLQYAREVPPWAGPADGVALAKLQALALAEQRATDELGRFLQKRKAGLGHLGPYPSAFTSINNAALHYVLPRLVAEQRAALAALEADFNRVADPEAQEHLGRLLHLKRRHLLELESLTAQPHSVTKVAV